MPIEIRECPCGRVIQLRLDDPGPAPASWAIWEANPPSAPLEDVWRSVVAARMMFTRTTICECGRRYQALNDPPWIEPVEG